jgi:hypothetical protein
MPLTTDRGTAVRSVPPSRGGRNGTLTKRRTRFEVKQEIPCTRGQANAAHVPLILYWTCRIWLKAQRGKLNEDPVIVAMRDPVS